MVILVVQHTVSIALLTELLGQVIKYRSVGSAVAFLGQITLFEGRRVQARSAQKIVFRTHSPAILRILMYGEAIKYNLERLYCQIGVIFCPKTNNISKKMPMVLR